LRKFKHPADIPAESKRRAEAILWNLHLEGPVVDRSGRAVQKLIERLAAVGWEMPPSTINRIVAGLGNRGGVHGDLYPYHYIDRDVRGKRTHRIELCVDPDVVVFPPNPFKNGPVTETPEAPAEPLVEEETFARQRQFEEQDTPDPVATEAMEEPEPEEVADEVESTELPVEPDGTADVSAGTLEPYRSDIAVRTNGSDHEDDDYDPIELPEDLLAELNGVPHTAMDMVSAAINLLSGAMAAHAGEQMRLASDVIDRQLDERFGEYRVLRDRLARTEGNLRHAVGQYEKVVGVARQQRKQLVALQRELARLRATA
jgi:hypothetical protein